MTIYRFESIPRRATKALPCPVCGKKVRRQRTFTETANPFNRNADGVVKTRREIWDSLGAKAAEWQTEPETCAACTEASR